MRDYGEASLEKVTMEVLTQMLRGRCVGLGKVREEVIPSHDSERMAEGHGSGSVGHSR